MGYKYNCLKLQLVCKQAKEFVLNLC